MTENTTTVAPESVARPTEKAKREVYSKDYVDIVLGQIRKRKLSMFALLVLILLYAVAIYAPLIANDRPIYFHGVDLASYRKAQRELPLVAGALAESATRGESGYRERLADGVEPMAWQAVVDQQLRAIENRIAVVGGQLSKDDRPPVDDLRSTAKSVASAIRRGESAPVEDVAKLRTLSEKVQREMKPVVTWSEVKPGQTVRLEPFHAWPIFRNLSRGEIFFMVLMAVTLLFPIWNRIVNAAFLKGDRLRIRRSRKRKALAFLAIPLLAALLWQGQSSSFFVSTYKTGLTNGDVFAKYVLFPPISYGIAETNGDEVFRPPTWHRNSMIDDDGFYVNGPRAGRLDPTTNIPRPAKPVGIEFLEPERNSTFRHFLGTDSLGRDLLARIVWGGRVSLAVGLVGTGISVFIGIILGSLAGYFGKGVDIAISRVIEIVQTFPAFFLILIVVAFVGPSILNIMVIIGLVGWTGVARLVRGEFIRLRGQEFVIASEALGVGVGRTIFRHILPNALGPVLVAATFGVASGILTESALSFLGLGIQLPVPSWGSLLIESRSAEHWWIQIFPGFLIFLTVMLYNLFGEGVRDALDPRLKVTH